MRMNFQSALVSDVTVIERPNPHAIQPEPKPIRPRPIKDPDYEALRKKFVTRFSRTLAYLAK